MSDKTAKEIILSLPDRMFDSAKEEASGVFHFVLDGDGGGNFTVEIKDGNCAVSEGLNGNADCELKAKAKTYRDIELGKTKAEMAFMMGKLKISNVGAMLKFMNWFEPIAQ